MTTLWVVMATAATLGGPLGEPAPEESAGTTLAPRVVRAGALAPGDTVGLIAPASPPEESRVVAMREWLQERGYRVKIALGYRDPDGYLASSDETRAAELNAMFADPEVRAIFCLRGGYGSPRILDRIDYEAARAHPKLFVGYSDITAVLTALHVRSGLVVFHGPMSSELSPPSALTSRWLLRAFTASEPPESAWGPSHAGALSRVSTLAPGAATGVLVGGNLSVLTSTIGTPFEVRTEGAVLFLEDVNEEPFRIDRMINQLRLAGKLSGLRGVILGAFTRCEGTGSRRIEDVFDDYFAGLGVPVIRGYPAGHIPEQVTLPIGVRVRLDADAKTVTLLESPVLARAD